MGARCSRTRRSRRRRPIRSSAPPAMRSARPRPSRCRATRCTTRRCAQAWWGGQVTTLLDATNQCVTEFMRGKALAADDDKGRALFVYLASLAPDMTAQALPLTVVQNIVDVPSGDAARGKMWWDQGCGNCHGAPHTGEGRISTVASLVPDDSIAAHGTDPVTGARPVVIEKVRHGKFFNVGATCRCSASRRSATRSSATSWRTWKPSGCRRHRDRLLVEDAPGSAHVRAAPGARRRRRDQRRGARVRAGRDGALLLRRPRLGAAVSLSRLPGHAAPRAAPRSRRRAADRGARLHGRRRARCRRPARARDRAADRADAVAATAPTSALAFAAPAPLRGRAVDVGRPPP